MTLEGEKRVIDTAASLGIEYSTVDDGWEERPDKWKFLHELAGYAQSRGVGCSYGAIGRSSTIRRTTTARCAAFWTRSRRSA